MLPLLVTYLVLHTLDDRDVHVNPSHIISLSETDEHRDPKNKLLTDKVHCVVSLSSGNKISVAENCDSVRKRIEELKR